VGGLIAVLLASYLRRRRVFVPNAHSNPPSDAPAAPVDAEHSPVPTLPWPADQWSEAFEHRFQPREARSVTVLTFSGRLTPEDALALGEGVRVIVKSGRPGFVCDLGGLDPTVEMQERVGEILRCYTQLSRAGGRLRWVHGDPYVHYIRTVIMWPPPPSHQTEEEAVEAVLCELSGRPTRG